jgi:hypothetical protein
VDGGDRALHFGFLLGREKEREGKKRKNGPGIHSKSNKKLKLEMEMVLRVSGFHLDKSSRARHDRARHILSTTGVRYTERTVNTACKPGELPQLCSQDETGALTVVGGMDAIDKLNDAGALRAECEAFKATKRLEYEARSTARSPRSVEAIALLEARVGSLEETERGLRRALEDAARESARALEDAALSEQESALSKQESARALEDAALSKQESARALEAAARAIEESALSRQESALLKQAAVRVAEQTNAELDALERGATRLERKLALASRAVESSAGFVAALMALALDEGVAVAP